MSAFDNATLMITGGTGSFGSTVLKHFLDSDLKEIRIFSRDEKKQDDMRHTEENSIPIEEFNKNYNITVLEQPYYIKQTLELIRQLQPEVKRIAFISDNRYISVVTRQAIKEVMQKDFPNLQLELLSSEQISTEELLDYDRFLV